MENQIEHPAPAMDEVLTEQLQRVVHRRLWLQIIASLLGIVLLTGSLGLLAAMLLGSMNNPSLFFRWSAVLVFWTVVIYLIYRQLRPAMRSIDLYNAAGLVEQREPEHEERLISAVDFSENPPDDQLVSRQMVEHVIRAARKDALNIDAARIISVKSVLLRGLFCLPVVLAWIIFCGIAPQTIALGLERMFTPDQGYSAESALAFQVNPGDAVVGQGSTFEITASDTGNTGNASQAKSENSFSVELQYDAGGGRQLAMTPTSPSSRRLDISDIESGFRYRVFSIQDSSPWYTVRMIPRPQITALELHFKYPAYTGLHDNLTTGPDWKIQALVGTQVQVLIHTSEPLSDQSQLTIAATDSTPEIDLPLQRVDDRKYQAVLNVLASTTYQIRLVNPQGVAGASGSPWPIVAVPDQPPTIVITSPRKQIDVRPDDVIPVLFTAGDDFGLTHVQAVVSVEHSASHVYEINLPAPNTTGFSGQWSLSVPDQLMLANQPGATHLYYLLQAVDNRQPTPQITHTDEYELVINSHLPYGYQQQLDKAQAAQFGEALKQAIKNLQQAQRQVDALRSVPAGQALSERQAQEAQNAADLTAQTARDLSAAAQSNQNSPIASAATQAQNIANNSIAPAADKIASAALNDAQSPRQRSADLANSAQELSNAASQLQQLQQNLAAQSNQEQLADSVSKLSQQQQQVAQQIADNPDSADVMRNQQQLAKNLQNLIKQNDVLQTPAAAKVQPQINALKEQTAKIISEQSAVNSQLNGNYQSGDLAQQQALLNKDIQQFNQSSAAADPNTSRIAPSNDALNAAVADLINQQYAPAHAGQQNIAADLSALYHQLNHLAKVSDQQQQSRQTTQQQNAAVTQQMQQITQDVTAATQKLQNPADPQSLTQGFQQMPKVAEEIKSAAQQLSSRPLTAQEQNELTAAVEHASQASDAASWDNAQQATQALQQAQSDLQQVQQQTSAPPPQLPPADQLNQLAQQANNLTVRQQQLAQQAAQLARQAQAAGQVTPDTAANLPSQISSAANQANQIAQQIQNTSPDLAKNLTDAQQEMNKAQEAQQQANNSQPNTPQAAQNQLNALQNMQAAQRALNGAENSPEMQNVSQLNNALANADQQQNQPNQENQNLEQVQQNQQQNLNEQNQGQQTQQNARQSAQNGQNQNGQAQQGAQGSPQNGQAQGGQRQSEQGQSSQQSTQSGQNGSNSEQVGQQAQNSSQNSRGQSGSSTEGSNQGSQEQQGQTGQQSAQGGQGSTQQSSGNSAIAQGSGQEQSGQAGQMGQFGKSGQQSAQSEENSGQPGQNGNNSTTAQGPDGHGSAMQHVLSAAQEIQNALQLQHQAASGDPVAAQQAAQALAAAANDLARAQAASDTGSQNTGGNSSGSGSLAMNKPGNSPAQNSSGTPNPNPGGINGTGASAAQNIGAMPPTAVAQMGISPAQWRNLGPLEQQQLINTARQSLPPGYEEMIRDYYIRLSETNSND